MTHQISSSAAEHLSDSGKEADENLLLVKPLSPSSLEVKNRKTHLPTSDIVPPSVRDSKGLPRDSEEEDNAHFSEENPQSLSAAGGDDGCSQSESLNDIQQKDDATECSLHGGDCAERCQRIGEADEGKYESDSFQSVLNTENEEEIETDAAHEDGVPVCPLGSGDEDSKLARRLEGEKKASETIRVGCETVGSAFGLVKPKPLTDCSVCYLGNNAPTLDHSSVAATSISSSSFKQPQTEASPTVSCTVTLHTSNHNAASRVAREPPAGSTDCPVLPSESVTVCATVLARKVSQEKSNSTPADSQVVEATDMKKTDLLEGRECSREGSSPSCAFVIEEGGTLPAKTSDESSILLECRANRSVHSSLFPTCHNKRRSSRVAVSAADDAMPLQSLDWWKLCWPPSRKRHCGVHSQATHQHRPGDLLLPSSSSLTAAASYAAVMALRERSGLAEREGSGASYGQRVSECDWVQGTSVRDGCRNAERPVHMSPPSSLLEDHDGPDGWGPTPPCVSPWLGPSQQPVTKSPRSGTDSVTLSCCHRYSSPPCCRPGYSSGEHFFPSSVSDTNVVDDELPPARYSLSPPSRWRQHLQEQLSQEIPCPEWLRDPRSKRRDGASSSLVPSSASCGRLSCLVPHPPSSEKSWAEEELSDSTENLATLEHHHHHHAGHQKRRRGRPATKRRGGDQSDASLVTLPSSVASSSFSCSVSTTPSPPEHRPSTVPVDGQNAGVTRQDLSCGDADSSVGSSKGWPPFIGGGTTSHPQKCLPGVCGSPDPASASAKYQTFGLSAGSRVSSPSPSSALFSREFDIVQSSSIGTDSGSRVDSGLGSFGGTGRVGTAETGGRVRGLQRHHLAGRDGDRPRLGVADLLSPPTVNCFCFKDFTCPNCLDKKKKSSLLSRSAAALAANAEELLVVEGMPSATWTPTALANWSPANMSLKNLKRFLGSLLGGDARVGDLTSAGFHVAWMGYQFLKQLEKKTASSENTSSQPQSHKKSGTHNKSTGGGGGGGSSGAGVTQPRSWLQPQPAKISKPGTSSNRQPAGGLGGGRTSGSAPGGEDVKCGGQVISTLREVAENSRRHDRVSQHLSVSAIDGKKSKARVGLYSLHRHHLTGFSKDCQAPTALANGVGQKVRPSGGSSSAISSSLLPRGRDDFPAVACATGGVRKSPSGGGSVPLSDEKEREKEANHDHGGRGRSACVSSLPAGQQADRERTTKAKEPDGDQRKAARAPVGAVPWQTVYGFEDSEWPRFVCGTIDRRWVLQQRNVGVTIGTKTSFTSSSRGKISSPSPRSSCSSSASQADPGVSPLPSGGASSSVPRPASEGASEEASLHETNPAAPIPSEAGGCPTMRSPEKEESSSFLGEATTPVKKKLRSSVLSSSSLRSSGVALPSLRSSSPVGPTIQDTSSVGGRKKGGVKSGEQKQEVRPTGHSSSAISSSACSREKSNARAREGPASLAMKNSDTNSQSGGTGSGGGGYEIAVQFEEFPASAADYMWPDPLPLPETLTPGLQVQVAVELRGRFALWWVDATVQSIGDDGTLHCVLHTDLPQAGRNSGVKSDFLSDGARSRRTSPCSTELVKGHQGDGVDTSVLPALPKQQEVPPAGQRQHVRTNERSEEALVKSEPTGHRKAGMGGHGGVYCSEKRPELEVEGASSQRVFQTISESDGESSRGNTETVARQRARDGVGSADERLSSIKRGRKERETEENASKKRRGENASVEQKWTVSSSSSSSGAEDGATTLEGAAEGCKQIAASPSEEEGRPVGYAASMPDTGPAALLPKATDKSDQGAHRRGPRTTPTCRQQNEQRRSVPDEGTEAERPGAEAKKETAEADELMIAPARRDVRDLLHIPVSNSSKSSCGPLVGDSETQRADSACIENAQDNREAKPSSPSSSTGPGRRAGLNKRPIAGGGVGGGGGSRGRPSKGKPMMFERFKTPQTYHVSDLSPPQIPLASPLTRRWRLRPRRLDVSKDLHPGAVICLSGAAASLLVSMPHSQAAPPPFLMRDAVVHRVFFARDRPPASRGVGTEGAKLSADGPGGTQERPRNLVAEAEDGPHEIRSAQRRRDVEGVRRAVDREGKEASRCGSSQEAARYERSGDKDTAASTRSAAEPQQAEKEERAESSRAEATEAGHRIKVAQDDDSRITESGAARKAKAARDEVDAKLKDGAPANTAGTMAEPEASFEGRKQTKPAGVSQRAPGKPKAGSEENASTSARLTSCSSRTSGNKCSRCPLHSPHSSSAPRVKRRAHVMCSHEDTRSSQMTRTTGSHPGMGKSEQGGRSSTFRFSSGVGTPIRKRGSRGSKDRRGNIASRFSPAPSTQRSVSGEGPSNSSSTGSGRKESEGQDTKRKETTEVQDGLGGAGAQQQSCFDGLCPGEPVTFVHLYFPYGNQQRIVSVEQLTRLSCYRLPYDLHAHFPPGSGQSVLRQAEDFLWTVPRAIPLNVASQASSRTRDKQANGQLCGKAEPQPLPLFPAASTLSARGRKDSESRSGYPSNALTATSPIKSHTWDEKTRTPAPEWKDFPPFCLIYASLEDSPFRLPRHVELAKLLQPELDFDALAEGVWRLRFPQWRRSSTSCSASFEMASVKSEDPGQPEHCMARLSGRDTCLELPCRLHHPSDGPPASWMPTVSLASWCQEHHWVPYPTDLRCDRARRQISLGPPDRNEPRLKHPGAHAVSKPETQGVRTDVPEGKERMTAAVSPGIVLQKLPPLLKQETEHGKEASASPQHTRTQQGGETGAAFQFSRGKRATTKTDVSDKKCGSWSSLELATASPSLPLHMPKSPFDSSLGRSRDLDELVGSGICPWAKLEGLDGEELDASTGWTSSALSLYEKLLLLRWNQQQAVAEKERNCRIRFSSPYRTVADDILQPLTHCAGWGHFSVPADLIPEEDFTQESLVQQPAQEDQAAAKGLSEKVPMNSQGLNEIGASKKVEKSRQQQQGSIRCPAAEPTPGEKERKHGRPGRPPAKLQQDGTTLGTAQKAVDRVTRRSSPISCHTESDQSLSFLRRAKAALGTRVTSTTNNPEEGDPTGVLSALQVPSGSNLGPDPMTLRVAQEPPHPIYWDTEIDEPASRAQSTGTRSPESEADNSSCGGSRRHLARHGLTSASFSDERSSNDSET